MFLELFDVEFHNVVYDLAEGMPMQDEDIDDRLTRTISIEGILSGSFRSSR